jgi:hypothetical protein
VTGDARTIRYNIHDALGRIMEEGNFSQQTVLRTDQLISGIYFIRLDDDGLVDIRMFVKE